MSNKNNIEDWIKSNRELFDGENLPKGHRDIFESKLDSIISKQLESKETHKKSFIWMKIAAAFVIGIAISSSVYFFNNETLDKTQFASSEIEQIEDVYSKKIKKALVPVRASKKYLSPEYRTFMKEMESLDKENDKLKELLLSNPDDERILNSIIENYKSRLQLLEQLKVIISNKSINKVSDEKNNG